MDIIHFVFSCNFLVLLFSYLAILAARMLV